MEETRLLYERMKEHQSAEDAFISTCRVSSILAKIQPAENVSRKVK